MTTPSLAAFIDANYVPPRVLGETLSQNLVLNPDYLLNATNATNQTNLTNQSARVAGTTQMVDNTPAFPVQTAQWPGKDGTLNVAVPSAAAFLDPNWVPGATEYVVSADNNPGYKKGVMN